MDFDRPGAFVASTMFRWKPQAGTATGKNVAHGSMKVKYALDGTSTGANVATATTV